MTDSPLLYIDQTSPPLMAEVSTPDLGFVGRGELLADTRPGAGVADRAPAGPLPDWLAEEFEIIEELPRGGMATLWRARRRSNDEVVVLREARVILRPGYIGLDMLRRLDHPNLVGQERVEVDPATGHMWQVLEFCAPGTVADQPTGAEGLQDLVADAAQALRYLHDLGIAHTDVKPLNVLRRENGSYALADLDTCILVHEPDRPTPDRTGHNTPGYTPPDSTYDVEFDWFQLGLTILHRVTGVDRPGENWTQIDYRALDDRTVLLLSGLMERTPAARWGYRQVEEWLGGHTPPTTQDLRAVQARTTGISVGYAGAMFHNAVELAERMATDWPAARRAILSRANNRPWLIDFAQQLENAGDSVRANAMRLIQSSLGEEPSVAQLEDAVARLLVLLDREGRPRYSPDGKEPVELDAAGLRALARDVLDAVDAADGELDRSLVIANTLMESDLLHTFSQRDGYAFLWELPDNCRRALDEYDRVIQSAERNKQWAVERNVAAMRDAPAVARSAYHDRIVARPPEPWESYAISRRGELGPAFDADAVRHRRRTRALFFAYAVSPDKTAELRRRARAEAAASGSQQAWFRDLTDTNRDLHATEEGER